MARTVVYANVSGIKLREAIRNTRMNYNELATQLGVHRASVSRWYNEGKIPVRHWEVISRLSKPNLLKSFDDVITEDLIDEIRRRGWVVNIERIKELS